MTKEEILNRVQNIVGLVLGIQAPLLTRETVALDIDGWNSLTHVTVMVQIETEFNITFNDEELFSLENVGALVDKIAIKITTHKKM